MSKHKKRKKRKKAKRGIVPLADIQRMQEEMYRYAEPITDAITLEFNYEGKRYKGTARCIGEDK